MNIPLDINEVVISRLGAFVNDKPLAADFVAPLWGVIVDTETTGLDPAVDRVVEIGLVPFAFCLVTGAICAAPDQAVSLLQDPHMPIAPGASAVNGIYDADVRGKSIDWHAVSELLGDANLIIAHNAAFDRPMIRKELQIAGALSEDDQENTRWGCTLKQIDWDANCQTPSRQLEVLCLWHGFFYSAHRAVNDCWATLALLQVSRTLPELYKAAQQPTWKVWADGAIFEVKDKLKGRRVGKAKYTWEGKPGRNAWGIELDSRELVDLELKWLQAEIYGRQPSRAAVLTIPPHLRFIG